MNYDFPQENEFEFSASISMDDVELKEITATAIENCIHTPKPDCFLKYYSLLAMYLFQKKLYDKAFITAEKGLQYSYCLYKELYPDAPNGYFDNSVSAFSHEYALLLYGGKASEKCKSFQDSASFYDSYAKNGHWVYSIIFAAKKAAKIYIKIDDKNRAISCLEYILENIQVSSNTKSFFENEINKLKGSSATEWPKVQTVFIKDDGVYAKANEYPLLLSKIEYEIPELKAAYHFISKGKNVFKIENLFWWAIQSLLYYEEIFLDDPKYTFENYQELNGMPIDFFNGDKFYKHREKLLIEKNNKLLTSNLHHEITYRFEKYAGKNIRHLIINKITKEGLIEIVKIIPANIIVAICDRINQDNLNNRSGLPDLIAYDKAYTSFQMIEVKKAGEELRYHQLLWLYYLRQNNVDAIVCRVD